MKLTDKAKVAFEKWYLAEWEPHEDLAVEPLLHVDELRLSGFYQHPISMSYGIYQDWAESLDWHMYLRPMWNGTYGVYIDSGGQRLLQYTRVSKDLQAGRFAAIKELDSLYNVYNKSNDR